MRRLNPLRIGYAPAVSPFVPNGLRSFARLASVSSPCESIGKPLFHVQRDRTECKFLNPAVSCNESRLDGAQEVLLYGIALRAVLAAAAHIFPCLRVMRQLALHMLLRAGTDRLSIGRWKCRGSRRPAYPHPAQSRGVMRVVARIASAPASMQAWQKVCKTRSDWPCVFRQTRAGGHAQAHNPPFFGILNRLHGARKIC